MGRIVAIAVYCLCLLLAAGGCTRSHYRVKADKEAYSLLAEKSACAPWAPPATFNVYPDPRSRFHDPTPTDDPCLPMPSPQLYAYNLPELPDRDPARLRPGNSLGIAVVVPPNELLATRSGSGSPVKQAMAVEPNHNAIQFAHLQSEMPADELSSGEPPAAPPEDELGLLDDGDFLGELTIVPIAEEIWQSLPPKCLARMLEFESVREEYERTFGQQPPDELRDSSQRLTLEDIVELASINSREFQTQKEALYDSALLLSLERFDYDLKFALSGNGTAADFTHNRVAGTTPGDRLRVPTTFTGERALATSGDFLARFANEVVLTFNGPDGFAADVGSSLLFDLTQRVVQRDIAFEPLTIAERRVVYAARDFGRARKNLFVDFANRYYDLLLTYRGIEIATQNYFSNRRGYKQAEAEYENVAKQPRFQVDQFEQRALANRRSLISACNALELSLDRLKIAMGLPPELPLNLDLRELEELTLRDEVTAAAERVNRAQKGLNKVVTRANPERADLLNEGIRLVTESLSLLELRQQRGEDVEGIESLKTELALLQAEETRLRVRALRDKVKSLNDRRDDLTPPPLQTLIRRTVDLVDSLLRLTARELVVAERINTDRETLEQARAELKRLQGRLRRLQTDLMRPPNEVLAMEEQFLVDADGLLVDAEGAALEADSLMPPRRIDPDGEMQETVERVEQLLRRSQELLADTQGGLVPLEMELDDAMLTALTLRYDVMTEREQLADVWRRLKLTADDLKSVMNLNAAQTIRTRSDVNRPFDFTFDDSQTRLSVTLDAPLNRKRQRNVYRRQLINYNQALRSLMAVEDGIKFDIRNDLRQLQFQREVYGIAVASAALAYQRRVSTRIQYRLAMQGIRAQDVLEAQQDYAASLVDLASAHIDYIQRRITFFLDLELLQVDDDQFWPQLYDERYQPVVNYQLPEYAQPAYGLLPDRVLYSKKVRRMLHVPPGQSVIFHPEETAESDAEEILTPHPDGIPRPDELPVPEVFRGPLPEPPGE